MKGLCCQGGQKCGKSNNFWDYYEDDIKRVVSLQSTCFRLSLGRCLISSRQVSHARKVKILFICITVYEGKGCI